LEQCGRLGKFSGGGSGWLLHVVHRAWDRGLRRGSSDALYGALPRENG
jgi:hypothetical protein